MRLDRAVFACGIAALGGCREPQFALKETDGYERAAVTFDSLLHPIAIATGPNGLLYVADDGDKQIKAFESTGRLVRTFGREGQGPGEFESLRGLAVLHDALVVLDGSSRLLQRWTLEGDPQPPVPYRGMEEVLGSAGDQIVLANDPMWSVDDDAGPLARLVTLTGVSRDIGRRGSGISPFASHVVHFVIPAGSWDGEYLWLAYLNGSTVERYSLTWGATLRVPRPLPYRWRRVPDDFDPRREQPTDPNTLPFDGVSLDLAVDRHGRAYVLSPGTTDEEPQTSLVDIIDPRNRSLQRLVVPEAATKIAVTDYGRTMYLLDTGSAQVTLYHQRTPSREGR